MKVIQVYAAHHGDICVAATVQDAVDYLFAYDWIDETTEVWDEREQRWVWVDEYFGPNWKDRISSMNLNQFNEIFEKDFFMSLITVYERKP